MAAKITGLSHEKRDTKDISDENVSSAIFCMCFAACGSPI